MDIDKFKSDFSGKEFLGLQFGYFVTIAIGVLPGYYIHYGAVFTILISIICFFYFLINKNKTKKFPFVIGLFQCFSFSITNIFISILVGRKLFIVQDFLDTNIFVLFIYLILYFILIQFKSFNKSER